MRKIKFRAWTGNIMLYFSDGTGATDSFTIFFDGSWDYKDGNGLEWSGEKELMQFTGLQDSKGKDIYEGDILNGIGEIKNYTVIWGDTGFILNFKYGKWGDLHKFPSVCKACNFELEVIGNIHENLKLLNNENK